LRADPVGNLVCHLAAQQDDPLLEQPVEDRVVEVGGQVAAASKRSGWLMELGHGSPFGYRGVAAGRVLNSIRRP
jgi:hypothetical protein